MLYSIASSKDAWVANIWVVVALSLGLLDNYIIESLMKWMYFLGDCMNTPLGWDFEDAMVRLGSRNDTFFVKSFYPSLDCR